MFAESVLPILGAFIQAGILSALTARPAAALISSWTLHLATVVPSPLTPQNVPGDFTEATFTGYAASAVTFASGQVNLPSGQGVGLLQNAVFACSASGTPNNINGYFIKDGAGNFILGEAFAAPIPIVNPGDFVDLTVIFPEPNEVQCQ
jgi:hypothetical protein